MRARAAAGRGGPPGSAAGRGGRRRRDRGASLSGAVAARHGEAVVERCDEHCRLATGGGPGTVVLKGERLAGSGRRKMCDCLVFRDDMKAVAVELKQHSLDAGAILEKLANGGREAARIAEQSAGAGDVQLFFAVLAKSYGNRSAQRRISQSGIRVGGRTYRVLTGRCGLDVSSIVGA